MVCEYCGADLHRSPCAACGEDAAGKPVIEEFPDELVRLDDFVRPFLSRPVPCSCKTRGLGDHRQGYRLVGRNLVTYWWGNCGPGYHEWGERVIATLPESVEVVEVPGTILTPWDADYRVTYIGPADTIRRVREIIWQYESAAGQVRMILMLGR